MKSDHVKVHAAGVNAVAADWAGHRVACVCNRLLDQRAGVCILAAPGPRPRPSAFRCWLPTRAPPALAALA